MMAPTVTVKMMNVDCNDDGDADYDHDDGGDCDGDESDYTCEYDDDDDGNECDEHTYSYSNDDDDHEAIMKGNHHLLACIASLSLPASLITSSPLPPWAS